MVGLLQPEGTRDPMLNSLPVQKVVERVLNNSRDLFFDSKELESRYGLDIINTGQADAVTDRGSLSTRQLTKFRASYKQFQERIGSVQQHSSLFEKSRWAIRDRAKFTLLVQDLKELIDGLNKVTMSPIHERQLHDVIVEELQGLANLKPRDVKLVQEAGEEDHKDWSDAATQVLEASILGSEDQQNILAWIDSADDATAEEHEARDLLMKFGRDPDAKGFRNLHWAARCGYENVVKFLIDTGVEVDAKDNRGRTAFICAVLARKENVVRLLLHNNADTKDGLSRAVELGFTGIVRTLLEADVDVEARRLGGMTPLLEAVRWHGRDEIVHLLIKHGVNLEARFRGSTPLMHAGRPGNLILGRILIQSGAQVNAKKPRGATALFETTYEGRVDFARMLLANGAEVDPTYHDVTPIMNAAETGHYGLCQLLIDHGAELEQKMESGVTALDQAAFYGQLEVARTLLLAGANPHTVDMEGNTPLIHAAREGHEELVQLFLENKVDADARDFEGQTALFKAARDAPDNVLPVLIAGGADIMARDKHGQTALHVAAQRGRLNTVQDLVRYGADVNAQDYYGETPLIEAATGGHDDITQWLLDTGASETIANKFGETPLSSARQYEHGCVAHTLLSLP